MPLIKAYHAHVYFELDQLALAEEVRQAVVRSIPELTYLGELIAKPVGPHPKPMFEVHIPADILENAVQRIEAARKDLDVLIHPVNDDPLAAHTTDATWLGNALPLRLDVFEAYMRGE